VIKYVKVQVLVACTVMLKYRYL